MKHTKSDLKQMQSLPLSAKIRMTERRIMDWYDHWNGNVYVSFSGGKDSTVLLDICRKLYPDIEALFVDTGLEYPEIRQFVKTFDNVTIVRPEMSFVDVIKTWGYPLISKEVSKQVCLASRGGQSAINAFDGKMLDGTDSDWRQRFIKYKPLLSMDFGISNKCCDVMKKKPAKTFEKKTGKKAILATMAEESNLREKSWLKTGCNAFEGERPLSQPMSFWTEQDVYKYIMQNNLRIASVYGQIQYCSSPEQMRIEEFIDDCEADKLRTTGCTRTGCIFCGFGCHLDKSPSRFESLKETHPRQYEYCMGGGEYVVEGYCQNSNGEFRSFVFEHDDGTPYTPAEIERFIEENQNNPHFKFERKWQPNKKGLGLGHVFDELNKIYGDDFIKY